MDTLALLSKHDLHVKELDDVVSRALSTDTHYIMKGSEVIARLNIKEVDAWIRGLDSHIYSVKSSLISGGVDFSNEHACTKWLSDTVLKSRNIETYKRFLHKGCK
jgi:hypothetical protein